MRIPAFQGLLIPFLLTMVVAGGTAGCAMNPVSGTPDLVFMSESSEINIGSGNDAKIRGKYGVYDSPALQAYVQQVGQKLAAQSHRPGLTYHFTVLDSPEVNAFALPGGYIYITRGILAYLNSEAELAAVLGHEIGHVTARHGVRQYTAATATGFVGAIIGVATGIGATQDLFNNVFGNAILSGYGRDHELENLTKCLAAAYTHVLFVSHDPRHVKAMEKLASGHFGAEDRSKLYFVSPEEGLALLDGWTGAEVAATVRGYKVRTSTTVIDPEEAERRRSAVAAVIAGSLKGRKPD